MRRRPGVLVAAVGGPPHRRLARAPRVQLLRQPAPLLLLRPPLPRHRAEDAQDVVRVPAHAAQGCDSIETIFGFSFGLKNGLRFHFDPETHLNYPFLNIFLV